MKRGADWYKREQRSFLEGVRSARLSDRQIAVYTIVLDLIYDGGGNTPNDPKYIAGYFTNIGPAAVRKAISELIEVGKLAVENDHLTQKRAKNEAKTKENLKKTRSVSGRLGGVSSGKSRQKPKDHEGSEEALASTLLPPDKIRGEESITEANASESTEPPVDPPPIEEAFAQFCQLAKEIGLPVPEVLDAKRKKAIRARLTQFPGRWSEALRVVRANPFYRGANDRGWRLTLDAFAAPGMFRKILERDHERAPALPLQAPRKPAPVQAVDDYFDRRQKELQNGAT